MDNNNMRGAEHVCKLKSQKAVQEGKRTRKILLHGEFFHLHADLEALAASAEAAAKAAA